MANETTNGSCLCGAVTYEVHPPYLFFQYCHCSRCRKATGAAHGANMLVKQAQLTWTAGQELTRRFELPEAKYFSTTFCSVCGSSLPWLSRNGKYYIVPAGTLDQDPGERPTKNIHLDSGAPWYVNPAELRVQAEEA